MEISKIALPLSVTFDLGKQNDRWPYLLSFKDISDTGPHLSVSLKMTVVNSSVNTKVH